MIDTIVTALVLALKAAFVAVFIWPSNPAAVPPTAPSREMPAAIQHPNIRDFRRQRAGKSKRRGRR